ncbi:2-methylaconitate cis-trans isomerase PrpF family protein [Romboutsia sp. 1001713B170207_170306_H8]|uniref:2-methylaconitate cis-trans isomerase PrpF family protein n=1 Tax=Romboutsia sp. 1001713B170207_170306_H8 TaxID=2787112 RepID=UPI00189A221C|nr:PrpF domain-containing protein [Romboutsia sp. 1001713B170207_170306_H8]
MNKLECTIFRGGTSKGVFINEENLPSDKGLWDEILLSVMGSPDVRQIDGLGGATSTTSKVAIISKSDNPDWDVNYTFAQVSIDKPIVSYKGNCGNISSAVGPYAIEKGLVEVTSPETVVRIYNTNTKKIIYSHVQTPDGKVSYDGDFCIAGVTGTSSVVKLAFKDPAGAMTGKLLPTGNVVDAVDVPGYKSVEVSLVDSSNPLIFVRASDVGLTGKELPDEIDSNKDMLERLETIRGLGAVMLGFIDDYKESAEKSPGVPKLTIVAEPSTYTNVNGNVIEEKDMDLLGRMMSMQLTHKTYALTGALCTATAATIEGTIVNQVVRKGFNPESLNIAHPGGLMQNGVECNIDKDGNRDVPWVYGYRTSRMIMDGTVYYK